MSNYIKFTEDEIQNAHQKNIADWLTQHGENVKKEGKNYIWDKHSSLKIKDNYYIQFSTGEKGTAITFLMNYFDYPFHEAVISLLDLRTSTRINSSTEKTTSTRINTKRKTFVLPDKNDNNRRVFAYLNKSRFIDTDIINYFIEENLLYEDTKHNCVFVGKDKDGSPRHAFKRGTYTKGTIQYKGEEINSRKEFSFSLKGNSDKLYVFESAIDILSFITLNKNLWNNNFVALGGLSDEALKQFLTDNTHIKTLAFCLDNDINGKLPDGTPRNHGQVKALELKETYSKNGYEVENIKTNQKDWNDELKAKKERLSLER